MKTVNFSNILCVYKMLVFNIKNNITLHGMNNIKTYEVILGFSFPALSRHQCFPSFRITLYCIEK